MITIPTEDFVGILADCIPFASTEEDLVNINAIRVDWDPDRLYASATDRYRVAVSAYDPTDPPQRDTEDMMGVEWGGADDPWSVNVSLADAIHLTKVFKLPVKHGQVPLAIDYVDGRLKVGRDRNTGHPAITVTVDGQMEPFPNLREELASLDVTAKVAEITFNAKYLADFAKVRPRGPMVLTFTGDATPCLVQIGQRFTAAIMPIRLGDPQPEVTP